MKISDLLLLKGLQPADRSGKASGQFSDRGTEPIDLKPGQLLQVMVAGHTPDGKVLLDFAGSLIEARSEVALPANREVWLEVKEGGATPVLALAGKKGALQQFLQFASTDAVGLGKAFEFLSSIVSSQPQVPPALELPGSIDGFVQYLFQNSIGPEADVNRLVNMLSWVNAGKSSRHSGMPQEGFVEGLTDLSAVLRQKGGESPVGKEVLSGLEKLAGMATSMHAVNNGPGAAGQSLFFLFPCFFAGNTGWGEWLFSAEKDEKKKEGAAPSQYTLAFFLEMSAIGALHLKMTIKDQFLQGVFSVSKKNVCAYLEENLDELKEILARLGYGPIQLHAALSEKNLLLELKEEIEEKARVQNLNILNVTA